MNCVLEICSPLCDGSTQKGASTAVQPTATTAVSCLGWPSFSLGRGWGSNLTWAPRWTLAQCKPVAAEPPALSVGYS